MCQNKAGAAPAEAVAQLGEEVVAEEREALLVGQDNEAEVGVDVDDGARPLGEAFLYCLEGHVLGREDPAPVAEEHLSVFHKALEDAHDLRGRLIRLVDDKAAAVLHGRHKGAVVPLDYAVFESWRESQRLDGGVSVQLNVLSLEA